MTKTAQHTKPKWGFALSFADNAPNYYTVFNGKHSYGAEVICSVKTKEQGRLIAAAPDLLEALKAVAPLLQEWAEDGSEEEQYVNELVNGAIAKAEGK